MTDARFDAALRRWEERTLDPPDAGWWCRACERTHRTGTVCFDSEVWIREEGHAC